MIKITCTKKIGRWRGGVFFPPGATEHPDDAFTADQLAAIAADPVLSIETVPMDLEMDKNPPAAPALADPAPEPPAKLKRSKK